MAGKDATWEAQQRLRTRSDRLRWMIALRWVGLAGISVAGLLPQIAGYAEYLLLPWGLAPLALGYNLLFWWWLRWAERRPASLPRLDRILRLQGYLQALCDMVVLCLLVYLNGGVECPILPILLLPLMLSGLLLTRTGAFLQANLGAALFAFLALAEYQGWIPHIPFLRAEFQHGLYRDIRSVAGTVLAMAALMNLTAYIMSSLGYRLDRTEGYVRRLLGQLREEVKRGAGQLAQATVGLRGGAEEVTQVAEQIMATVQQIAQGTAQQAEQLEGLSRNLERLAEAGRRMAEGAQEAHQTSEEAVAMANRGREAAEVATGRMEEITRVFVQTEEALGELARWSEEISGVALAISRFAERTDLLALNAGIEAARAGEHGRGFAVVASEVKKLAASSSASAERVGEVVAQAQEEIRGVVEAVRAGAERVVRGQEAIETLRQVLDGMAGVIVQTDKLAGMVEHLAQQQQEAHQKMMEAMEGIASTAKETAAGAEEMATAMEEQVASFEEFRRAAAELAELAGRLDQAVADLAAGETGPVRPE